MTGRTVYVNGNFVPEEDAKVSVFDRGFVFADAIYEVVSVIGGKLLDFDGHIVRLERSLRELDMKAPLSSDELLSITREVVSRNSLIDGIVYLQITRGNPGDRDFAFPDPTTPCTVVMFSQANNNLINPPAAQTGYKVISVPDLRWGRRDIKTVQLLYPSMAKMAAKAAGVQDAWFVDQDGFVTEGTSNNCYIVLPGKKIVTRPLSNSILHGITRAAILKFASVAGYTIEERPFTIQEAQESAVEAFLTSASAFVMPIVEVDGKTIGSGKVGDVAVDLRKLYLEMSIATAI